MVAAAAVAVIVALAWGVAISVAAGAGGAAPTCRHRRLLGDGWSFTGALAAVGSAGKADAWAVGNAGSFPLRALALRWTGRAWTRVATPDPNGQEDLLDGVAVISSRDAWAVGGRGVMSGITATLLVEHWNGVRWAVARVPNAGQELSAVTATSARSVWAVGNSDVSSFRGPMRTFSLRWTGRGWVTVSTPNPGQYNDLAGVAGVPGSDRLWAVGSQQASDARPVTPLIDEWNGTRWVLAKAPDIRGGALSAVAAAGPRDAWAVGALYSTGGVARAPLALHFNGLRWSRVRMPARTPLTGVAERSAGNVWAVGGDTILHRRADRWRRVSWAAPARSDLGAITVAGGRSSWSAWAAGSWHSPTRPLIAAVCS